MCHYWFNYNKGREVEVESESQPFGGSASDNLCDSEVLHQGDILQQKCHLERRIHGF